MGAPEIVVLALATNSEPWNSIFREAQAPAFLDQSSDRIRPYWILGRNPDATESQLLLQMERNIRNDRWLQNLGRVSGHRPINQDPGQNSWRLTELIGEYHESRVTRQGNILYFDIPESLATIGLKTLWAIRYLLENEDFTHLLRTNTSSFWDFSKFAQRVEGLSVSEYAGYNIKMGRIQIASGAGLLISRSRAMHILEKSALWNHDYLDDQALGVLNSRLGFKPPVHLDRFDFNPKRRLSDEVRQSVLERPNLFHWRCKSLDPRVEIQRIKELAAFTKAR